MKIGFLTFIFFLILGVQSLAVTEVSQGFFTEPRLMKIASMDIDDDNSGITLYGENKSLVLMSCDFLEAQWFVGQFRWENGADSISNRKETFKFADANLCQKTIETFSKENVAYLIFEADRVYQAEKVFSAKYGEGYHYEGKYLFDDIILLPAFVNLKEK